MMKSAELRKLPRMDMLLADPALTASGLPHPVLRRAVQEELSDLRTKSCAVPDQAAIIQAVLRRALDSLSPTLTRAVNATGVILHAGLGRAPLPPKALAAAEEAAGYCPVEMDFNMNRQGRRGGAVEALLADLTGAEAATVVNNNAAAILIALVALAYGKGVALSRGELLEMDGGFRVPDMMEQSGCRLVEVGTTNRTRQGDYLAALENGSAQFLMKVHTSNCRVTGYAQETSLSELVGLGRAYGFPVLYDLGTGLLLPARQLGVSVSLPSVSEAVHAGTDLVCFSGDKLLGGPQAGILVGRAWAIDAIKKHPVLRALRPGKITLAALEATLRLYRDPELAQKQIPVLAMLAAAPSELSRRAETLTRLLKETCGKAYVVRREKGFSEAGGGILPDAELPTTFVTLTPTTQSPEELAAALRLSEPPIMSLVRRGKVLLDMRTLQEGDEAHIAHALRAAL